MRIYSTLGEFMKTIIESPKGMSQRAVSHIGLKSFIVLMLSFLCLSNSWGASWMVDTNWTRFQHIRTAQIVYASGSNLDVMPFVGQHYDLAINPTSDAAHDSLLKYNPNVKMLRYGLLSSFRDSDLDDIDSFCVNRALDDSLLFMWVSGDSASIRGSAAGCSSDTTTILRGGTLQFCGWSQKRYVVDFRNDEANAFVRWKFFSTMENFYDGFMEDEAHYYASENFMGFPFREHDGYGGDSSKWVQGTKWTDIQGWEGYTYDSAYKEMRDLCIDTLDDMIAGNSTGWMKALCDTAYLEEKMYLANVVGPGRIREGGDQWLKVRDFGMGVWIFENSCSPIVYPYSNWVWDYMDSIVVWDTGYAVVWLTIFNGNPPNNELTLLSDGVGDSLDGLYRAQMERLTFYYMAATPERFFFMLSGNALPHYANSFRAPDTAFKWFPAIEYDIGTPAGPRYVVDNGSDGAGQNFNLYRRNYTKSIMLYRPRFIYNSPPINGTIYDNTSAVTYNLGGSFQQLYADGTLGPVVTSTTIKHVEGKIFIPEGGGIIIDTLPPDTVTIGALEGVPFNYSSLGGLYSNDLSILTDLPDYSNSGIAWELYRQ